MIGPTNKTRNTAPYLPPKSKRPRLTMDYPLPHGTRRGVWPGGYRCHQYLQHDGSWMGCVNRRACRECIREDAMKTTKTRLREALTEHFGLDHIMHIADDEPLFPAEPVPGAGRALGDASDRHEMMECVDGEFGIFLPDGIADANPTIESLAGLVDVLVASRDASPH